MAETGAAPETSWRGGPRARLVAVLALWAIVMSAVGFASGCYGHNCDGDVQVYGRLPGEGRMLNADTWESTPVDGPWIPYPKQRTWVLELRDLGDRTPDIPLIWISAEPEPARTGNFAAAAGNLAEWSFPAKGSITVKNGTCADYYMRVTITAAPRSPATTGDPDAALPESDAGIEASVDAADAGDAGDAEAGP